jgi:hypothetical protein
VRLQRSLVGVLTLWCALCAAAGAQSEHDLDAPVRIEQFSFAGTKRTREETLLELLPRRPPAWYSERELREFDRRISNLAIFDSVLSERSGDVYHVELREKWTLIPMFDFASGKTARDLYAELGAVEYNAWGSGTTVSASVSWVQRGLNFSLAINQHAYRPQRWAFGLESGYETSSLRFDTEQSWTRRRWGVAPYWTAPLAYQLPLRFEVGASYFREDNGDVEGSYRPASGHELVLLMGFTWDRYRWHDLAPRGYLVNLTFEPGWLFGPELPQSRSKVSLLMQGSLRIADTTALMMRVSGGLAARGNANFSFLVGSYAGVRGIEDAFYRTWLLSYANIELRQAVRLAPRWALQGVLFTDSAAFETMTVHGERGVFETALSSGGGLRVIPLWLSDVVLRVDYARLLNPTRLSFWQFGITQYF